MRQTHFQRQYIKRKQRINALGPERYYHPEYGYCSLYLVSGDGINYQVRWNENLISNVAAIPIVTNPVGENGTVFSGVFYAFPLNWVDSYFYVYHGDYSNDTNYKTIAELKNLGQGNDDDGGTGNGTGNGGVVIINDNTEQKETSNKKFFLFLAVALVLYLIFKKKKS